MSVVRGHDDYHDMGHHKCSVIARFPGHMQARLKPLRSTEWVCFLCNASAWSQALTAMPPALDEDYAALELARMQLTIFATEPCREVEAPATASWASCQGEVVGRCWNTAAQCFVRALVQLRALRAPPAVRAAASSGWAQRWWGALSVALQLAVAGTAWAAWPAAPRPGPGPSYSPALDRVIDIAASERPNRLLLGLRAGGEVSPACSCGTF